MAKRQPWQSQVTWFHYGHEELPNGYTLCVDYGFERPWVIIQGRLLDTSVYLPGAQCPQALWNKLTSQEKRMALESAFDKLRKLAAALPGNNGKPASQAVKKFPNLVEFLSSLQDSEGNKRQLSKITVSFHEGCFKAALNEFDVRASCFCSLPTLEGLLEALEAKLGSSDPEWRLWPSEGQPGPSKGSRKK